MTSKRIFSMAFIFALFVLATAAFAGHGHGERPYNGCGNQQQLSPEQQKKFDAIQDDFIAQTQDLREDLWANRTELNALAGNSQADPKHISELVDNSKELRAKLIKHHAAFAQQVEKEVGIKISGWHGKGHGFNHRHNQGHSGMNGGCPNYN